MSDYGTGLLDAVVDDLADVCEVIAKYNKTKLSVDIHSIIDRALQSPCLDASVADDEPRIAFLGAIDEGLDLDLKLILTRLVKLKDKKTVEAVVSLLSQFSEIFSVYDSVRMDTFYNKHPQLLVLRLMEQFTVKHLEQIGVRPTKHESRNP